MAEFTGNFTLLRSHLEWNFTAASLEDEDVRVCTFHNLQLVAGVPDPGWPPGDLALLHSLFEAWWSTLKNSWSNTIELTRAKYYLEGPAIVPPQPPIFEDTFDAPGTATAASLPPQLALTVTEKVGQHKNWGRFYLPAHATADQAGGALVGGAGRPSAGLITAIATATLTLYNGAKSNGFPFVIYKSALPDRTTEAGTALPARPASAIEVSHLQVDNVYDVLRSRRHEVTSQRDVRPIT